MVDFILWRDWEPIGGGQIGIPRDEYSSYTSLVVDALLGKKSAEEIAALLNGFTTNEMGMSGNLQHDMKVAKQICQLDRTGRLLETDLEHYLELGGVKFLEVFDMHGFPTSYYFLDNVDIQNTLIFKSEDAIQHESFMNRWRELVDLGYGTITIQPGGYYGQAFLYSIIYDRLGVNSVPVGKTKIHLGELLRNASGQLQAINGSF
jgi:hypothetical protein